MLFAALIFILLVTIFKLYITLNKGINKCSKHLVGKVVIVTGGNSGIGFETAKDLAFRGARVILACRSEGRGIAARDRIIEETGNKDVHYRNLDLASLSSVRKFAEEFINTEKRLDILINNAGVLKMENEPTEDGLPFGLQTNHFGPFLLTNLLLPILKSSAPSRIINVSSMAYSFGNLNLDNLNVIDTDKALNNYGVTKLCNILMTVELSERLAGTGVTANCLHPGAVRTNIANSLGYVWTFMIMNVLFMFFVKTAWEGAQTTIYLAVSPEVENVSGCYFVDCKKTNTSKVAQDKQLAKSLWEKSEQLVKL